MKIDILKFGSHEQTYTPSQDKSVDGVEAQCDGSSVSFPPSDSKEHTQHYGKTMYGGDTPVLGGEMDGQEDITPAGLGAVSLPDQGDKRHKGTGKGNSDPAPAMPGA